MLCHLNVNLILVEHPEHRWLVKYLLQRSTPSSPGCVLGGSPPLVEVPVKRVLRQIKVVCEHIALIKRVLSLKQT